MNDYKPKIIYKDPIELKVHPLNEEIYGEEEIDNDLLDDIKFNGILNPILVNSNNIIISGARRVKISKKLGIKEIPCIIKSLSETEEKIALISSNKSRIKTYIQEMNEIDMYLKLRDDGGLDTTTTVMVDDLNTSKGTYHRKRFVWKSAKEGDEKAKQLIERVQTDLKYTPTKAYNDLIEYRNEQKIRNARKEASNLGEKIKDIDIFYFGDFQEVLEFIPDGTIDAIITDPPYPIEYIDCWDKLGNFAQKKLRPGGWLIAYSGQKNLPEVFKRLEKNDLKYYWTTALYHNGTRQDVWGVDLNVMWKPIIVYAKPPVMKIDNRGHDDYIISLQSEKGIHNWQQSESGVKKIINTYSNEGDLIVDPFVGGGTFLYVAREMNRKVIGAEIDFETYNIAKARLNNNIITQTNE